MSRAMSQFATPTHMPIDDHGTIAAMEDLFSALAGLITATGGSFAIAGHDIHDMTTLERARRLTPMYDAGEVVVGYADARNGDIVNIVIEHLAVGGCEGARRPCWRALFYVEEPEGHVLRGALAARSWRGLAQPLFDAVNEGLRRPLPSQTAALEALDAA